MVTPRLAPGPMDGLSTIHSERGFKHSVPNEA